MVQVPYSLQELDMLAEEHYNSLLTHLNLDQEVHDATNGNAAAVFQYILPRLKEIIVGRPSDLEAMAPQLEILSNQVKAAYRANTPAATVKSTNKWFNSLIFQAFNYDHNHGFTERLGGRLAYDHALRLNLATCPYCNSQFTFTITKKGIKVRPHFDHFLNKSHYPYFALSFYNLIPSCYPCNSSLKGAKPFSAATHLHPFVDSIEDICRFRTNISSVDFLVNKKDFEIALEYLPGINQQSRVRAEKSLKDFAILDRYHYHKDYAAEIITKSHLYTGSTIKDLMNGFTYQGTSVFSSEEEILETLMGNYLRRGMQHKRILSKLSRDICSEFGIAL